MVEKGDQVLVVNRTKKDWPGLIFPGGHIEPGESFVDAARREVYEETGLLVGQVELCGHVQYDEDGPEGPFRRIIFLYRTNDFTGQIHASREGEVSWIKRADLPQADTSESLLDYLKVIEDPNISELYYRDAAKLGADSPHYFK